MKSLFKKILILIFICLLPASKIFAEDKIRIGLVVPLTGEYSTLETPLLNQQDLHLIKLIMKNLKLCQETQKLIQLMH